MHDYAAQLGLRYTRWFAPQLGVFAEGRIGYAMVHEIDIDFAGGDDLVQHGAVIGLSTGGLARLDPQVGVDLAIGAAIGVSHSSLGGSCYICGRDNFVSLDVFARVGF